MMILYTELEVECRFSDISWFNAIGDTVLCMINKKQP